MRIIIKLIMEIIIAREIMMLIASRITVRTRAKIKVHTAHITAECTKLTLFAQEVVSDWVAA